MLGQEAQAPAPGHVPAGKARCGAVRGAIHQDAFFQVHFLQVMAVLQEFTRACETSPALKWPSEPARLSRRQNHKCQKVRRAAGWPSSRLHLPGARGSQHVDFSHEGSLGGHGVGRSPPGGWWETHRAESPRGPGVTAAWAAGECGGARGRPAQPRDAAETSQGL